MTNEKQPQFAAVAIDTHDKGKTKKKLNAALDKTVQALHDFCIDNGFELTKKASASVTLEISFHHIEAGIFVAKAKIKEKVPSAAASVQMLTTENGKVLQPTALELDAKDDPRQMTFAHAKGDASNPKQKEM